MGEECAQSDEITTQADTHWPSGLFPGYFPVLVTTYLKVKRKSRPEQSVPIEWQWALLRVQYYLLRKVTLTHMLASLTCASQLSTHAGAMKGSETMATWALH